MKPINTVTRIIVGILMLGSLASSLMAQNLTNTPPFVRILTPTNQQAFPPGVAIPICAEAGDRDDFVATVEFFADATSLGITTNNPAGAGPRNPFCLVWSNAPVGGHVLKALATDSRGARYMSPPVSIMVGHLQPPPVMVTVRATDGLASEPGVLTVIDPGVFTIHRDGATNIDMAVFYSLRGTASNGVDYAQLSGRVVIPAGSFTAPVIVNPLLDNLDEGLESVVLRVLPPVCAAIYPPPPECYQVGMPGEAVVQIADKSVPPPTNCPPVVRITSPPNGAVFHGPIDIPIFAYAMDRDDKVASVEFFAGTNSLGLGRPVMAPSNTTGSFAPSNTWMVVWSNAPFGGHVLSALATDSRGAFNRSEPVKISVVQPPPPPTNRPVLVSIVARDPIAIEGTNCWVWPSLTNNTMGWHHWPTGAVHCITNCGPKNASFVVRRHGVTNDAITVAYHVGGQASNGVDYVELSGSVTIPAGERSAIIPVVPIDDNVAERNETLIIRLKPSAAVPPDYLIGMPAAAAVLIVDEDRVRPVGAAVLADRSFHLNANGPDGAWFRVECSDDMVSWTPLCVNQVVNGSIDFIDPDASTAARRFYRAVPEFSAPAE